MNTPVPANSEEVVFARALVLPAAQRGGYLDEVCGTDSELRRAVDGLLRAHEDGGEFMEAPAAGEVADLVTLLRSARPAMESAGDRIGRYKLLQKIGEGGCGTVYMAEQEESVRRRVALKVIKPGMDTKEVIARFEAERQALAMMEHPNIARVLDAGETDTGRPFFVMELVRGLKITDYCDQHSLPTAERLKLFTQVCHAVQHAHQKGIIHRDLKPSNILVTLHDGAPLPKVIDFGIAKATQGRLTDSTLFTAFEQFIGTPAYMSPEQAQLSSMDVDTRSDIYSLGVLLYELLTGRTPFESKELMEVGLDEMRRQIREMEPPRPSTRLRTLDKEKLTTAAQHRHVDAPRLIALIHGDLDWIVMRCLEKDRTRRYETATSLAEDIQRHVADEPVVARPPSRAYQLQKMFRRNRPFFLAAGVVGGALAIGFAASSWLFLKERAARLRAIAAEAATAEQRRQIERLPLFFQRIESLHREGKVAEVEAAFRELLALERTLLGNDHALLAESLGQYGEVLRKQGRLKEAEVHLRESLAISKRLIYAGRSAELRPSLVIDTLRQVTEILRRGGRAPDIGQYFTENLTPPPESRLLHASLLRARADHWMRLWRLPEATADLTQGVALHPDEFEPWYMLMPLLLEKGDVESFRHHARAMLEKFGATTDASVARRAAKVVLLWPEADATLQDAHRLAGVALKANPSHGWAIFAMSISELRQGRHAAAIDWARKVLVTSDTTDTRRVQTQMLIAMALFRLDRVEEARSVFAEGQALADAKLPRPGRDLLTAADWENPIITMVLQREAQHLLGVSSDGGASPTR